MSFSFFFKLMLMARALYRVGLLFLIFFLISSSQLLAQEDKLPFSLPVKWETLPKSAKVVTNKGDFIIEFFREESPITVRNFEYLGKKRFFENLKFHRYVENFIIQGGDPLGTGKGGPGYNLPPEFSSDLKHLRGTVAMARLLDSVNPERLSNGSQFYICLTAAPHLYGMDTVFGEVISGMDVVDRLREEDFIIHVLFPPE